MNAAIAGTSVPEQLIGVVFDALQALDATIKCFIGQRETENYAAPHSVIAVPIGAPSIDSAIMKPGSVFGDTTAVRQLALRHFRIEWWCHDGPAMPGEKPDFTNAEALFLSTLVAIRLATDPSGAPFHNGIKFGEEEWIDQQSGADGFARSGHVIKFVSTLDLPIYDLPLTLVPLTASPNIVTTVTMGDDTDNSVTINEG